MKRSNTHRSLMIVAALGLSLWAAPAGAAIDHYQVKVDGLACPFCAYGLEKKLKELPGAREIHIDLDGGQVRFDVVGALLMPDAVIAAIRDAGFTAGGFTLTASGKLHGDSGGRQLDLGDSTLLQLASGAASSTLKKLLKASPAAVQISGGANKVGGVWRLQVDAAQALKAK